MEVKSGKAGKLKSLHLMMSESTVPVAVRFYSGKLNILDLQRPDGSTYKLLSLPFYLVYRLEEIIDQFLKR